MDLLLFLCFLLLVVFLTERDASSRQRRFGGAVIWTDRVNETIRYEGEQWFTQVLDHNNQDGTTWQQRYLVKQRYFDQGKGVAFLLMGGQGPIPEGFMTEGNSWINYAEEFGALCFQLEHRFYGLSRPTSDMSIENLQYLSSQQALADATGFIRAMNQQYDLPQDVKWIVFGGSYAGSLAVWMRLKYPNVVHGAVSSSAPLLAKVDFNEFFQVVANSCGTSGSGQECVKAIKDGFADIENLLSNSNGWQIIQKEFSICEPLQSSKDVAFFLYTLADYLSFIVQYGREGNSVTINTICSTMTNEQLGTARQRLASINSHFLQSINQKCFSASYDSMINYYQRTEFPGDMSRQWTYQTCTEFGFFATFSQDLHVFGHGFPVEFFEQRCADIYGPNFNSSTVNSAVEKTNSYYGALNLQVTNVVFVHGSLDPWHALGVTTSISDEAPAIYIQGTSHCADMKVANQEIYPQLAGAYQQIQHLISGWVS